MNQVNIEDAVTATANRYYGRRTESAWNLHVAVVALWLLVTEQDMMQEAA